jgi:hypothetical protein
MAESLIDEPIGPEMSAWVMGFRLHWNLVPGRRAGAEEAPVAWGFCVDLSLIQRVNQLDKLLALPP